MGITYSDQGLRSSNFWLSFVQGPLCYPSLASLNTRCPFKFVFMCCVCECMCSCVCVWRCACLCTCAFKSVHIKTENQCLGVLITFDLIFFFKDSSQWTRSSLITLGWQANKLWKSPFLSITGVKGKQPQLVFSWGFLWSEFRSLCLYSEHFIARAALGQGVLDIYLRDPSDKASVVQLSTWKLARERSEIFLLNNNNIHIFVAYFSQGIF